MRCVKIGVGRMFWSRLGAVVPVVTNYSPLPDTTWAARRGVALGNGASDSSSRSSIHSTGTHSSNLIPHTSSQLSLRYW